MHDFASNFTRLYEALSVDAMCLRNSAYRNNTRTRNERMPTVRQNVIHVFALRASNKRRINADLHARQRQARHFAQVLFESYGRLGGPCGRRVCSAIKPNL